MSDYLPRPYQSACIAALAQARSEGTKKGLVVMASGLGKTLTTCFDLQQYCATHPDARVLYLCHQENILLQSKAKFQKIFSEERSYGMFTGSNKTEHAVSFLFSTLQTMRDHRAEFAQDCFDYIIIDEAHHTPANTYRPTVDYFQPQFLLGLTATKDRMDGQDLLDIYGQILYSMDIYDGWIQGWLAKVDYRIMFDDLKQEEFQKYVTFQTGIGKISLAQLNRTIFAPQHDKDIVASIREQTADLDNPTMFVFCPNIAHAMEMVAQFGEEAAVVHSAQSADVNTEVLENFRQGNIRIIISVNMLNEGIDIPETDVVVFLRATSSLTIFFQQLGRGLRISGNKRLVRILDFVTNIERISMILEMEETAKKRIQSSGSTRSDSSCSPLVVNIPATRFRIQRIDVERLFVNIRRRREWTKEEVIAGLLEMDRNGQEINFTTIKQAQNLPYPATIKSMFDGSINNALREAHINQTIQEYNQLTQEDIIAEGKRMVSHGTRITFRSIKRNKRLPSANTIISKFGSVTAFAALCDQAPLTIEQVRIKIAWDYWKESEKVGHWLSLNEIDRNAYLPSASAFRRALGAKKEDRTKFVLEVCGPIHTQNISNTSRDSKDQDEEKKQSTRLRLAQEFYEASLRKGSWLSQTDFTRKNGVSCLPTYRKYFGGGVKTIINFLRLNCEVSYERIEAQRETRQLTPQQITRQKTDETLIKEYWVESSNAGHWLSYSEVDKRYPQLSSSGAYRHRFGNLKATRCLAVKMYGELRILEE